MEEKKWSELWLKYTEKEKRGNDKLIQGVYLKGFDASDAVVKSALEEWTAGLKGMYGMEPAMEGNPNAGVLSLIRKADGRIRKEGYELLEQDGCLQLLAGDEKGLLYGVFHLLRLISMEKDLRGISLLCNPDNPLRMLNHWDNMDGSIERGYSGNSFFFEQDRVIVDGRTRDYARLAASVGINGVVINNVNVKQAATYLITDRYFAEMKAMAEIFAESGTKL